MLGAAIGRVEAQEWHQRVVNGTLWRGMISSGQEGCWAGRVRSDRSYTGGRRHGERIRLNRSVALLGACVYSGVHDRVPLNTRQGLRVQTW